MRNKFTEQEIIAGLKNSREKVFTEIYEEFSASLHYFSLNLTHDSEESKDIVSTTFNKLWKLRHNFNSLITIKNFLYVTAKNQSLDFLRYRKRQANGIKEMTSYLMSTEQQEDVERLIVESDFLNTVYNEIQQLPDQCKEIFILSYFHQLSSGEIAIRLGISASTVTTQRSRAIKFLRNVLKEEHQFFLLLLLAGIYSPVCGECLSN